MTSDTHPLAYVRPGIHCAWNGPSLLVTNDSAGVGDSTLSGFYFRETRYLSRLELLLNNERPFCCSTAEVDGSRLEASYVYPPVDVGKGGGSGSGAQSAHKGILSRGLDLMISCRVRPASLEACLRITNRWSDHAETTVSWLLAADYADVSEAQGGERRQEATVSAEPTASGVRFRYQHPSLPLVTEIAAEPTEWSFADGRLSSRILLKRQSTAELRLVVRCIDSDNLIDPEGESEREHRVQRWLQSLVSVDSRCDSTFVTVLRRAAADLGSLALLEGSEDEWLAPAAGIPLYQGIWGRDALTAVWQASILDCGAMAECTLNRLGRTLGRCTDAERDEEPGRVLQQQRRGPLARLGITPFDRYYADYASPFDFIFALGHAYAWNGNKGFLQHHWDSACRILEWARQYADKDGDGYLEYQTMNPAGPTHQGWKDSDNAVVHADGRQAEGPIAACEVQGYYYAALQMMSALSGVMQEPGMAVKLWHAAQELKSRFNRDYWMQDEGFIVLGLDGRKRQIQALTSNAGQCLATGIVSDDHVPQLVKRLFEPELFSGWGIRTLSTDNPAYNPLDYHLGSVWLVENATIIFGLRRYGFDDYAVSLTRALYDLARLWPAGRVPECVGGYSRNEHSHPGAYPRANGLQAWNQSAWALILHTILGLRPLAFLDTLVLDPALPEWFPEVTLKQLRVGRAAVSLRFYRSHTGESHFEVLEKSGTLHLVRQQPINSLTASIWDRLGALTESLNSGLR